MLPKTITIITDPYADIAEFEEEEGLEFCAGRDLDRIRTKPPIINMCLGKGYILTKTGRLFVKVQPTDFPEIKRTFGNIGQTTI